MNYRLNGRCVRPVTRTEPNWYDVEILPREKEARRAWRR